MIQLRQQCMFNWDPSIESSDQMSPSNCDKKTCSNVRSFEWQSEGSTSPTPSEGWESDAGWPCPHHHSAALGRRGTGKEREDVCLTDIISSLLYCPCSQLAHALDSDHGLREYYYASRQTITASHAILTFLPLKIRARLE